MPPKWQNASQRFNARPARFFGWSHHLGPALLALVWLMISNAAYGARGRVHSENGRLVTDRGTLLRGVTVSMDDENHKISRERLRQIRDEFGLNSIHLYVATYDADSQRVRDYIDWAGELGLYVIATGGYSTREQDASGKGWSWDMSAATLWTNSEAFWKAFAPKYAARTHVIFEWANEPVAHPTWYKEERIRNTVRGYQLIRRLAPDTHILLWNFTGHLNQQEAEAVVRVVRTTRGIDYSNASLGLHPSAPTPGVSPPPNSSDAWQVWVLDQLQADGYVITATESEVCADPVWKDRQWWCQEGFERLAGFDARGIGWQSFHMDFNLNDKWKQMMEAHGPKWQPDFGNWPLPAISNESISRAAGTNFTALPAGLRRLLPGPDEETGFVPLWGRSADDGWAQCGSGHFTLTNGVATSHGGMGLWWHTNRMFTNFVIRGEWRFENRESDTGVFIRFANPGNDPWKAVNSGHELELGDDPEGKDPTWKTGTLYPFQPPTHVPTKPVGEWNSYEFIAIGHTYIVRINGETVNVWADPKQRSAAGYIGLQNYQEGKGAQHRQFRIRELPSTPPASASLSEADYYDKVRGEWLGKLVGGALGMPLEGWNSEDVAGTFGRVNAYVDGYFTERGASGPPTESLPQRIPADGAWHTVQARLTIPPYATNVVHPAPVVHIANRSPKAVLECEVRGLNFGSGVIGDWHQVNQGWYFHKASQLGRKVTSPRAVALSLPAREADMLRMLPSQTKTLRLPPGRTLDLELEVRCTAGEPEAHFSIEYLSDRPGTGFLADDDTSWTMIGLLSLEKNGPDLSAKQIANSWMEFSGPGNADSLLAEILVLHRLRSGIEPPESGNHPIGEAIGGQMRGEIWGLVAPGRPALAAEYARRDAMVSHRDNGIYGEQFIAAMMAAAFYEKNVPKLIQTGLTHIPASSKYAEVIRLAVALHAAHPDFQDALKTLKSRYEALSYVDVFVDAGIVTLALLYGDGDFEKSLLVAAACGNDTDCNAANVGALIGCLQGAEALPAKWIEPIGDDFRCGVKGHEQWKISELARRICAAGRKVQAFHGDGIRFSDMPAETNARSAPLRP